MNKISILIFLFRKIRTKTLEIGHIRFAQILLKMLPPLQKVQNYYMRMEECLQKYIFSERLGNFVSRMHRNSSQHSFTTKIKTFSSTPYLSDVAGKKFLLVHNSINTPS